MVINWLLDTEHSDPSVRWQVMRDLMGAPRSEWQAERARVETEGWGARLLGEGDDDGRWAGGAHFPAFDTTINVLEGLLEYERVSDGAHQSRRWRDTQVRSISSSDISSAVSAPAGRPTTAISGWGIPTADTMTSCGASTTFAPSPRSPAGSRPTPGWVRRSGSSAPGVGTMGHGCSTGAPPDGSGLKSMMVPVSPLAGSRCAL